jgi:recombination protein RecT
MTIEAQSNKFSAKIRTPEWSGMISETLGSKARAAKFKTRIISAVSNNPKLQDCNIGTILSVGLLGESLNLSPSPQLGHYYIVPYAKKAVLQIGYKGIIQLAIRSGAYKKINVLVVKEDELINYDPIEEIIQLSLIEDQNKREVTETIGFYAFFELISGFRKSLYWTKEKMEKHARRFTKDYERFWGIEFDKMGMKTILKQLLGTWGLLSEELNTAFEYDGTSKDSDGNIEYTENNISNEVSKDSKIENIQIISDSNEVDFNNL